MSRDRRCKRFEQVVPLRVGELLHGARDRAVVDRVLEAVG
jgi:hypothetical protein